MHDLTDLQQRLARLEQQTEHLPARAPAEAPPPPRIAVVSLDPTTTSTSPNPATSTTAPPALSTGYVLDFRGDGYAPDTQVAPIQVYPPSAEWALWRPQAGRWELLAPDLYVAVPPCGEGIPAAEYGTANGDVPGRNVCCIFRLQETDTLNSGPGVSGLANQLPPGPAFTIAPLKDAAGNNLREPVYNIYPNAVLPLLPPNEQYIRVARDRFGKWLCEPPPGAPTTTSTTTTGNPATSTSSTTTTTTTTGIPLQSCSGSCKWTWSVTGNAWSLGTNGCGPTTTTTSSPTTTTTSTTTTSSSTSSTTSTTGGPTTSTTTTPAPGGCLCPSSSTTTTTTTGGPTSSTTSTTGGPTTSTTPSPTTTTTPAPCNCLYPSYCGTTNGECTYTYCVSGISQPPQGSGSCTSTTAAPTTTTTSGPSTSSTTTTTCDCNTTTTTTTTAGPTCSCGNGCDWCWSLYGYWMQCSLTIPPPLPCCATCPCSPPLGFGYPCATAHTACVATTPPPPPTTPPPFVCTGSCLWCPFSGAWQGMYNGCPPNSACACSAPSVPPNNGACGCVSTPCVAPPPPPPPPTTTTTTTLGPCGGCYTTTTTAPPTTTTTTSTTPGPCPGQCKFSWSGSSWTQLSSTCIGNCVCAQPPYNGQATCQTEVIGCLPPPPTTTTTTSPPTTTTSTTTTSSTTTTTTTTTSSTTTTTTTCAPCSGPCGYQCVSGNWVLSGGCSACCGCLPVPNPGCVSGNTSTGSCQATTTTAAPTTTTTTTTTTTAAPCVGVVTWSCGSPNGCAGGQGWIQAQGICGTNSCPSGQTCVAPPPQGGAANGATFYVACACGVATTTTPPPCDAFVTWICLAANCNPGSCVGWSSNGASCLQGGCGANPCEAPCPNAHATQGGTIYTQCACPGAPTTTPPPCSACTCQYSWDNVQGWEVYSDCGAHGCAAACSCGSPPFFQGTFQGEIRNALNPCL